MRIYGIWVLLLPGIFAGGCMQPLDSQGRAILVAGRQQYGESNYTQCSNTLSQFLEKYSRTQEAGEARYLRGLCYREMGTSNEAAARADLENAAAKGADAGLRALSRVALGHMCYEKTTPDLAGAIEHYEKSLKGLKNEPPKDVVLYRLGTALQKQGKWSQADRYFSQCFDAFGNSTFAPYARKQFGSKMFRIQVTALSDLRNAQKKVQELRGAGWKADWTAMQKEDGKMLYQVRVGQYPNYGEAQKALAGIAKTEPDAEIVTASSAQTK